MFFFNKPKASIYSDFGAVAIDMHSHLIPSVDDGAKDVNDSLLLIKGLKDLGFKKLITTPHTLQDIHPNTIYTLKKGHSLIQNSIPEGVTLTLSSEYYMDEQFQNQVDANELLPLPGNRLLVEFSQISRPHDIEEVFFDLSIKGYQVILAHPERYLFFHKQFNYYQRIKEMGVELQVNALSLTDHYGKGIRSIAEKLIEKNMIDFIGTDTHHLNHIEVLKKVPASKHFAMLVDSGLLKNAQLA
jgi:protein-tyrosine phosphatase